VDNRFRPLRAIIFVVVCLALIAFTYVLVFRVDFGGSTIVTVQFDGVGTIQSGSPVRQSGVKVGSVARVSLSPEDRRTVNVDLSLYKGLVVRKDDQVSIVTGGLLGDQYIDITPGRADAPVVGPGDKVVGRPGLDLRSLVNGGSNLVQDLGSATKTIATFLNTHADALDRIVANAERGTAHAADAAERVDRILAKAENQWDPTIGDLRSTLQALRATSLSLKAMVDGLNGPGTVATLLSSPATAKSTAQTLANIQSTTESLKTITAALESALK